MCHHIQSGENSLFMAISSIKWKEHGCAITYKAEKSSSGMLLLYVKWNEQHGLTLSYRAEKKIWVSYHHI